MRKIIKKPDIQIKEFRCSYCGCIWESDEYKDIVSFICDETEERKIKFIGDYCPTCDRTAKYN